MVPLCPCVAKVARLRKETGREQTSWLLLLCMAALHGMRVRARKREREREIYRERERD